MNRAFFPFHLICYHFNFNFDLNSSPPFDLLVFISVVDKREQKENKYANSNQKKRPKFSQKFINLCALNFWESLNGEEHLEQISLSG